MLCMLLSSSFYLEMVGPIVDQIKTLPSLCSSQMYTEVIVLKKCGVFQCHWHVAVKHNYFLSWCFIRFNTQCIRWEKTWNYMKAVVPHRWLLFYPKILMFQNRLHFFLLLNLTSCPTALQFVLIPSLITFTCVRFGEIQVPRTFCLGVSVQYSIVCEYLHFCPVSL